MVALGATAAYAQRELGPVRADDSMLGRAMSLSAQRIKVVTKKEMEDSWNQTNAV